MIFNKRKLYSKGLIIQLLLICVAFTTTNSCKTTNTKSNTNIKEQKNSSKEGYFHGTIVKSEIDGCTFLVKLDDGKLLNPINLDINFRENNLKVLFKFAPTPEVNTICMRGETVKIIAIEKSKK